jgi:hypothetical protein
LINDIFPIVSPYFSVISPICSLKPEALDFLKEHDLVHRDVKSNGSANPDGFGVQWGAWEDTGDIVGILVET